MCRQAGYFEHASYLAKKFERHEDYLSIQIEDAGNFGDALSYLRRLGAEAVCSFLVYFYLLIVSLTRLRAIWQDTVEPCSRKSQKKPPSSSLSSVQIPAHLHHPSPKKPQYLQKNNHILPDLRTSPTSRSTAHLAPFQPSQSLQ